MAPSLTERIRAEFEAEAAHAAAGAASKRRQALVAALGAGLPGNRDDGFRYAPLRVLERLKFAAVVGNVEAEERAARLLPQPLADFARLVFVDGQLCAGLSSATLSLLARGIPVVWQGATLRRYLGQYLAGSAGPALAVNTPAATDASGPVAGRIVALAPPAVPPEQRFALLNAAFANETLHIDVAQGTEPARIELVFVTLSEGSTGASYPRVMVNCTANSDLRLVERHIGASEAASFSNASLELNLAANARCSHYRLQSLGLRATHLETLRSSVGAAAQYQLHCVQAGAAAARSTIAIDLAGAGSAVDVHVAQVAAGKQVQDTQMTIEHRGAATTTTQTFRGIASGRARVAFNGHMIVRDTARGANTQQSLRALLDGVETEADLRPQLEIYTDDVRARHGATVGKLDQHMLFYLLSRGIDQETAQSLLKWAFLAEVLGRIDIAPLRQDAQQLVLGLVQGLIGEALS